VGDADPINSTLEGLLKVLSMDNVIGEPIESEGRILIPVTRIGMGFGAGQGTDSPNKGSQGLGAGGGAAVEPIAFVVINKTDDGSEIEVISLKSQEPLNTAISEISELALEFLNEWRERQKKNEEKREQMRKGLEDIVPP
jgi:uncharacterized spore protein YtfJ